MAVIPLALGCHYREKTSKQKNHTNTSKLKQTKATHKVLENVVLAIKCLDINKTRDREYFKIHIATRIKICLHVPALLISKNGYCSQVHEEKHWMYNWQAIRPNSHMQSRL